MIMIRGRIDQLISRGFRIVKVCVFVLLTVAGVPTNHAVAQLIPRYEDPCGYPDTTSSEYRAAALSNWGYGYDSLKADLARWSWSPYVQIDSVGATVQNRAMYVMTIQASGSASPRRKRVWVHARTHPNEVQGTWVINEMIELLLGESLLARLLRDSCIMTIMPMYNPDGVELGLPRENANGVDLESNWAANPAEPEVQVLRRVFTQLMAGTHPIQVALNMHSALACRRYFVYHAASGTSQLYASLEQQYISSVRSYFPGGIEPYTYFISWSGGAPTYYPESWFWYNHHEAVLALTYEDKNCTSAGGYDSTAFALLRGVADFLHIAGPLTSSPESTHFSSGIALLQNFPNPFNATTILSFNVPEPAIVSLGVYDVLGRKIGELAEGSCAAGTHTSVWNAEDYSSGVYFARFVVSSTEGKPVYSKVNKLVLMK